jgi:hypothetical protein
LSRFLSTKRIKEQANSKTERKTGGCGLPVITGLKTQIEMLVDLLFCSFRCQAWLLTGLNGKIQGDS